MFLSFTVCIYTEIAKVLARKRINADYSSHKSQKSESLMLAENRNTASSLLGSFLSSGSSDTKLSLALWYQQSVSPQQKSLTCDRNGSPGRSLYYIVREVKGHRFFSHVSW